MSAEWSNWPGTEAEKQAFLKVIARNCECKREIGVIKEVCRSHLLLSPSRSNHAFWKHLVYGRRLMEGPHGTDILAEEFDATRPKNIPGRQ